MEEAISFTIPQKWMQKGYTEQKSGKIQKFLRGECVSFASIWVLYLAQNKRKCSKGNKTMDDPRPMEDTRRRGATGWQSMFARRAVYICQESACMSCGICLEGCPAKAVFYHRNHPIIDSCLCDDCGWCEANCPAGAILRTVQMTPV